LSSSFLTEAKKPGKKPQLLMQIETPDALSAILDTKAQWDNSSTLLRVDTSIEDGSVTLADKKPVLNGFGAAIVNFPLGPSSQMGYDAVSAEVEHNEFVWGVQDVLQIRIGKQGDSSKPWVFGQDYGTGEATGTVRLNVRDSKGGTLLHYFDFDVTLPIVYTTSMTVSNYYCVWGASIALPVDDFRVDPPILLSAGTRCWLDLQILSMNAPSYYPGTLYPSLLYSGTNMTFTPTSGRMLTANLDLLETPSEPSKILIDDNSPADTNLSYIAFADDFTPPTTLRGSVVDGSLVGTSGFRYVRIQADFASSYGARPVVRSIALAGGNDAYVFLSNTPNSGGVRCLPLLIEKSAGVLKSQINRDKVTTLSEVAPGSVFEKSMSNLLATGYLKNKPVTLSVGYEGLALSAFAPIFTGSWYDYRVNQVSKTTDIQLRDILTPFIKIKLPRETSDASGNITTASLIWTDENAIQILLDIWDAMGLADRFIAVAEWEALRDGDYSGAEYNLTRTLFAGKPVEAFKLLSELTVLLRIFAVPYSNGKLYPAPYNTAATPAADIDARFCDFKNIDGQQRELYTRQLFYYSPYTTTPSDKEGDYSKLLVNLNLTAEENWGTVAEKRLFDKWGASTTLLGSVAQQWRDWFSNPAMMHAVSNVPIHLAHVQPGDLVNIQGAERPADLATYPGYAVDVKCLVMSRKLDVMQSNMELVLLELDADPYAPPGAPQFMGPDWWSISADSGLIWDDTTNTYRYASGETNFSGKLNAVGTWASGYRPTQCRVTFTTPLGLNFTLRVYDVADALLLYKESYTSEVLADFFTYTTDIHELWVGLPDPDYVITKIEFL
jgi:hypothetical protein